MNEAPKDEAPPSEITPVHELARQIGDSLDQVSLYSS